MRSSIVLTGALLGRLGQASFCDPGGCVIGDRPIDLHLKAFARFGCQIRREDDNFLTVFAKRLNGVQIPFPFSSVGATQNAILCAVCAKGETVLTGCAKEPEVVSLCRFLNGAGAKIEGAGSKTIRIEGVKKLCSTEFSIDADRIVAGTCLIGVLAAGGEAFLRQAPIGQLTAVIAVAQKMGAQIVPKETGTGLLWENAQVPAGFCRFRCRRTEYPGLSHRPAVPSCWRRSAAGPEGTSRVSGDVFLNARFRAAHQQFGSRVGSCDRLPGRTSAGGHRRQESLRGALWLESQELRGGAALVLAGLCAEHKTVVENCHFIRRGYEDIVRDFRELGADIGTETENISCWTAENLKKVGRNQLPAKRRKKAAAKLPGIPMQWQRRASGCAQISAY